MITKRDLMFSSWEHEKANERIEAAWGNYIYRCFDCPTMDAVENVFYHNGYWYVEMKREATQVERDKFVMAYDGRGNLEERVRDIKASDKK